ncbi:MAG: hypothetical protein HY692_02890 [Cyanobacteria bacterium NC_groundwater_1444_Ag_S-0.65um_54_12]|nr:hypothetical protein [Cyanobacteria bacterium NC_groundwater_1444_Ag_S-0.65um_54_12]
MKLPQWAMVTLLASLLAACQPPRPVTAVSETGNWPDHLALARSGRLEIAIRPARQLQTLPGIVARVSFTLTGENLPQLPPLDIWRSQFQDNQAVAYWNSLLPGPVHIAVALLDRDERKLGTAAGATVIETGKTARLELTLTAQTGAAAIAINPTAWGEPPASVSLAFTAVSPYSWQPAPPMAIARAGHSAVMVRGELFVVGGDFNDEIERFDPLTRSWLPQFLPNNPAIAHPIAAAGVLREQILVVGRDQEFSNQIEITAPYFINPFALPSLTVSEAPSSNISGNRHLTDLLTPRTAVGVASDQDQLYVLGGVSRRVPSRGLAYVFVTFDLLEVLSGQTSQWSRKANMPTARGSLGTAFLAGKLYAAGGFLYLGNSATDPVLGTTNGVSAESARMEPLATLEAYDPKTDTWTSLASMPTPRRSLALVASAGRLWALGGVAADGRVLATVESYDPLMNTWRSEPPMLQARALLAAVRLTDGSILAIGGLGSDGRPLRNVDAFNIEALSQ